MERLKTTFAGLDLKNPFIVSSSSLTANAENNFQFERAGAAAIVLKSLFEEQIMWQSAHMLSESYGEGSDYLQGYVRSHYLDEYTRLLRNSKKLCSIPIIASINCYTDSEWEEYAHILELAGADAIELNLMAIQTNADSPYGEFEKHHVEIVKHVRAKVNIPIIVKLGNNITNPVRLISQLHTEGANAVVLFNRFYHTDIDIDKLTYTSGPILSHSSELSNALRWIAIASGRVSRIDYAASGGVTSGRDIVKCILSGASAVEVCSVLFEQGNKAIMPMLIEVRNWMIEHGYESIGQFKGMLSARDLHSVNAFERTQFLKFFGEKKE